MSGEKFKKFYKFFCVNTILLCTVFLFVLPAHASFSLERKHKETKAKITRLKFLESLESNKLYKNQKKLERTEQILENSKVRYTSTQVRLGALEQEYNNAQIQLNKLNRDVCVRIRNIYKVQRLSTFSAILSSNDVNTFADVIYYQNLIMSRDKRKLEEVTRTAQRLANLKRQIESEKISLSQSINDINQQQRNIQRAIADNSSMINKLRNDRAYYEKTERELARQSDSLGEMINKSGSSGDVKIAGGFMKPLAGRITSPFGWRIHPIFKSRTFHSGVDIAGVNGAQVRASNSGKVIFVNWYGGYGKVVIIDHGTINGAKITTLYAHLSSFKVNVGEKVNKGQPIGIQGSTGYSTGPHCHFEVRKNGKPTNPLNYI